MFGWDGIYIGFGNSARGRIYGAKIVAILSVLRRLWVGEVIGLGK